MKKKIFLSFLACFISSAFGYYHDLSLPMSNGIYSISRESALRIGIKVWYNECNGRISGLTSWNEGEKFASLGIGHFTWSPVAGSMSEKDGFPQLIKYMENKGVTVPAWLQGESVPPCPWQNRMDFHAAQNSQQMRELRQFLVDTIPLQAQFMVQRLINALPKIIANAKEENKDFILEKFSTLSSSPHGLYVLVDYVNFKGEGTSNFFVNRKGGWGLLQVVEGMKWAPTDFDTIEAFVWSANRVLTERVRQAPLGSNEEKWLPGWRKRLSTYLD